VATRPPKRGDVFSGSTYAHKGQPADGRNCEDPKEHRRAKQKEGAHAYSRWVLRKEQAHLLGWRKWNDVWRSMSEHRCCYETRHKNQNVDGSRAELEKDHGIEELVSSYNNLLYKRLYYAMIFVRYEP
jgi:hypothetical protein